MEWVFRVRERQYFRNIVPVIIPYCLIYWAFYRYYSFVMGAKYGIYGRTSLVGTPGDRQSVYSLSGIRITNIIH